MNKNFKLFHGTLSTKVDSILKNGLKESSGELSATSPHDHWLGHGIYFYEDEDLAHEWARKKSRSFLSRHKLNSYPAVFEVAISVDSEKICNLDNCFQLAKANKYLIGMESELVNQMTIDFTKGLDVSELGKDKFEEKVKKRKRCFAFDCYKSENNIELIMYTFDMSYGNHCYSLQLSKNEKQLCLSSSKCITNTNLVVKGRN